MLNGKYIPLDVALESLYASSAYLKGLSPASACVWAGEALDIMGVRANFVHKVTDGNLELGHPQPVSIEKYRGVLPPDIYKIDQVRSCNTGVAYRDTTNSFHEAANNYSYMKNASKGALQGVSTYSVTNNYIITNVEEDSLEIAYLAFPVDKDGVPLLPDDEVIKLGIAAYIKYKAYLPQWELGNIPDKVMEKTEQDYDWRIGAAISRANSPNADQLESMKNVIVRLIPKIDSAHRNFFENVGNQEVRLKNHSSLWNNHL